jgi:hypothetical protein
MSEAGTVGPHAYRLLDDIFHWEPHGEVLPAHARRVCEIFHHQIDRYGYLLWRIDGRGSIPLGLEARRLYALWFVEHKPHAAVAAFGADRLPATLATLTRQAVRLMSGHSFGHQSFDSEDAATAYLHQQRAQFLTALRSAASVGKVG